MKPLAIFIAGVLVVFGLFAVVLNMVRSTERVFVVVDSSFPMSAVWSQVPGVLDDIDDGSYSEFALATEKELIHGWQDRLDLGAATPFAPCEFGDIESYTEVGEADELILVTTDASCPTGQFTSWQIVTLSP